MRRNVSRCHAHVHLKWEHVLLANGGTCPRTTAVDKIKSKYEAAEISKVARQKSAKVGSHSGSATLTYGRNHQRRQQYLDRSMHSLDGKFELDHSIATYFHVEAGDFWCGAGSLDRKRR